jgi:hypothetical protein
MVLHAISGPCCNAIVAAGEGQGPCGGGGDIVYVTPLDY